MLTKALRGKKRRLGTVSGAASPLPTNSIFFCFSFIFIPFYVLSVPHPQIDPPRINGHGFDLRSNHQEWDSLSYQPPLVSRLKKGLVHNARTRLKRRWGGGAAGTSPSMRNGVHLTNVTFGLVGFKRTTRTMAHCRARNCTAVVCQRGEGHQRVQRRWSADTRHRTTLSGDDVAVRRGV